MTLTEFLEARLADKERIAKLRQANQMPMCKYEAEPEDALREVAAGRAILARYERALAVQPALVSFTRGQDDGYTEACRDAVADLAAVWSDHADYDPS